MSRAIWVRLERFSGHKILRVQVGSAKVKVRVGNAKVQISEGHAWGHNQGQNHTLFSRVR